MGSLILALTLGFFGSFHCIGMCGPLALALPVHGSGPLKKILLILSYNAGRVLTYFVFGLFAGIIGKSFVLAGAQQILSVVVGVVLLFSVLIPSNYRGGSALRSKTLRFLGNIKQHFSKLFLKRGYGPLFLIGLLNGLLPCGLVYIGVAGAVATSGILKGGIFMAAFGMGTLPIMLMLPMAGNFIGISVRNTLRKTMPVIVTAMALLLILRGLNLGIPYISPKFDKEKTTCHEPKTPHSNNSLIKCSGQSSLHRK
jgi:uncharacterized protein